MIRNTRVASSGHAGVAFRGQGSQYRHDGRMRCVRQKVDISIYNTTMYLYRQPQPVALQG